ncbi:hypothetical protein PC118_g19352 [Phytophthora cactorum]|uniref:Uncharacterized protein n=1 Tax=Phytophthora cactorum TaxID=29920 RepID=A0A8T1FC08_9STRA|nr:hypothetical protein PC118_g19352 [Phytophthora cactorum]
MSDKSDGGTASGVWVPSSPSSSSSDSSDSEPYTKRPESGREGKRKRVPHKTRSPRGGRRAHAKQPKHRSRGRSSHSSAHSNGSSPAASELPESGTEAPESGSTSSMGVSDADAGNDGRGVVALDEWIKANSVWEQLKTAASSMDLETEKLFFFGVMNYDFIHWCDVSANLSNGIRPSADWR